MKKYCKHCEYCTKGNPYYCNVHKRNMALGTIKYPRSCTDYKQSDGDIITGKPYRPYKSKVEEPEQFTEEDNYKNLIAAMIKQGFDDIRKVVNSQKLSRVSKVDDITVITYEICKNSLTDFVLKDAPGVCSRFLSEIAPMKREKYNNFKITDKRTGVNFITNLDSNDFKRLSSRKYLEIERVE